MADVYAMIKEWSSARSTLRDLETLVGPRLSRKGERVMGIVAHLDRLYLLVNDPNIEDVYRAYYAGKIPAIGRGTKMPKDLFSQAETVWENRPKNSSEKRHSDEWHEYWYSISSFVALLKSYIIE